MITNTVSYSMISTENTTELIRRMVDEYLNEKILNRVKNDKDIAEILTPLVNQGLDELVDSLINDPKKETLKQLISEQVDKRLGELENKVKELNDRLTKLSSPMIDGDWWTKYLGDSTTAINKTN